MKIVEIFWIILYTVFEIIIIKYLKCIWTINYGFKILAAIVVKIMGFVEAGFNRMFEWIACTIDNCPNEIIITIPQ